MSFGTKLILSGFFDIRFIITGKMACRKVGGIHPCEKNFAAVWLTVPLKCSNLVGRLFIDGG